MSARPAGFRLTFTQLGDAATLINPKSYTVTSYTYPYQSKYGGEPIDLKTHTVKIDGLDTTRQSVQLTLDEMRPGYVYELQASGIRNTQGQPLLHSAAYYTLNRVPK